MITTCTSCGHAYEAGSEEQANEPVRECPFCRIRSRLRPGQFYDLSFPARPELGIVRVQIAGTDEPTPCTACGMPTVPVKVVLGSIPKPNPPRMVWPGEVTTLAIGVCTWTLAPAGGAA